MIKTALISMVLAAPAFCDYSAVNDFPNVATVPVSANGVWSYGYSNFLQPFVFLPDTTPTNDYFAVFGGPPGAVGFYTPEVNPNTGAYNLPTVLKNITGAPYSYSTISNWPANVLLMHPGPNDEYSVVNFTAPATANYSVSGLFTGLDIEGTTTDAHALIGMSGSTTPQFSANVNGYGPSSTQPFAFTTSLAQGQSIYFAVGYGTNNLYNDSTGFDATITATPEPGFYGLLALGLAGLVVAGRYWKSSRIG